MDSGRNRQDRAQRTADRRLRWRLFAAGFAVRLLYILLAHTFRVRLSDDHFEFGWEMGRIGRALATGYGYSDPFTGHTGPTAWTPPLYTLLIGSVFKVFGVYTRLSAFVLLTVNSLLSAWTAVLVWEIGLRCCNRRVAWWSGWLWALYPAAMQYAVRWIWEMCATAAVFTALVLLVLRMRGVGNPVPPRQTGRQWALFGWLWGVLALLNPAPLLMLPVMLLYLLAPARSGAVTGASRTDIGALQRTLYALRTAPYARIALSLVLFLLVLTPWTVRNYVVFHRFIPLRDNFGAENYQGNSPWSTGFPWGRTVPLENRRILAEYAGMGEPAWTADRGAKAQAWIRQHPNLFAKLTMKRIWMYWAGVPKSVEEAGLLEYARLASFQFLSLAGLLGLGLALRRRVPGAWLLAAAFALLPLPYYTVTVQARFRHVLEPLICVLGVFLFQSTRPRQVNESTSGT